MLISINFALFFLAINGGKNCVRKRRFESEGYISSDYVLPDGSEDSKLKEYFSKMD
jgi:hypothetical protein